MIIIKTKIQLRFAYRYYIGRYRILGTMIENFLVKRQQEFGQLGVNKHTEIVIEGFPRAGANFVAAAVKSLTNLESISYRRHCISQLKEAKRLNTPTIILVRHPMETIASTYIATQGAISLETLLKYYFDYYTRALALNYGAFASSDAVFRSHDTLLEFIEDEFNIKIIRHESVDKIKISAVEMYEKSPEHIRQIEAPIPTEYKADLKRKIFENIESEKRYNSCVSLYRNLITNSVIK